LEFLFANAKVHALPSFRESPGLATLEAALYGANCVVSIHSPVAEYFADGTWTCDPSSPSSIRNAVLEAWTAPRTGMFGEIVERDFNYDVAGARTKRAYDQVLARRAAASASG
jgi:hypothetical protein